MSSTPFHIPRNLRSHKAQAELAYRICLEVRRRNGAVNYEDAQYYHYEDAVNAFLREMELSARFESHDAFEEFIYQIIEIWPSSASGNRFKLTAAISAYEENPEAYHDERFRKDGLCHAATLCWQLAQAHGGQDAQFYLSARIVADTIGVSRMAAHRIMKALVGTYRVLEIVEHHPPGSRKATTYRFRSGTHST